MGRDVKYDKTVWDYAVCNRSFWEVKVSQVILCHSTIWLKLRRTIVTQNMTLDRINFHAVQRSLVFQLWPDLFCQNTTLPIWNLITLQSEIPFPGLSFFWCGFFLVRASSQNLSSSIHHLSLHVWRVASHASVTSSECIAKPYLFWKRAYNWKL